MVRIPAICRIAIVLVLAALLLTACGHQSANDAVIGMRPAPSSASATPGTIDVPALTAAFTAQLNQANSTPDMQDNALAYGLLPIDSVLTLRQTEHLVALQQIGNSFIQARLTAIASVRSQVAADRLMGSGQKYILEGYLDSAAAGLQGLQVTLARDLLVDAARADVTRIGKFRVYGLLLPQARLLLGAYEMQSLAGLYRNRLNTLQGIVNNQLNINPLSLGALAAQQSLNNMAPQVAAMFGISSSAIAIVAGLTPAGYPGNKGVVRGARQRLVGGKAASDLASYYMQQAKTYLGV